MPEGQAHVRASGSTRLAVREYFAGEAKNAERIQKFNLGLSDDDELPAYVHQDYPKAMYSPDGETIVVQNVREEHERQQDGYYSTLAEMLEATAAVEYEEAPPVIEGEYATEEPEAAPAVVRHPVKRSHAKKRR